MNYESFIRLHTWIKRVRKCSLIKSKNDVDVKCEQFITLGCKYLVYFIHFLISILILFLFLLAAFFTLFLTACDYFLHTELIFWKVSRSSWASYTSCVKTTFNGVMKRDKREKNERIVVKNQNRK